MLNRLPWGPKAKARAAEAAAAAKAAVEAQAQAAAKAKRLEGLVETLSHPTAVGREEAAQELVLAEGKTVSSPVMRYILSGEVKIDADARKFVEEFQSEGNPPSVKLRILGSLTSTFPEPERLGIVESYYASEPRLKNGLIETDGVRATVRDLAEATQLDQELHVQVLRFFDAQGPEERQAVLKDLEKMGALKTDLYQRLRTLHVNQFLAEIKADVPATPPVTDGFEDASGADVVG
jgi:hypothetical protein